jgi:hypothetical protein
MLTFEGNGAQNHDLEGSSAAAILNDILHNWKGLILEMPFFTDRHVEEVGPVEWSSTGLIVKQVRMLMYQDGIRKLSKSGIRTVWSTIATVHSRGGRSRMQFFLILPPRITGLQRQIRENERNTYLSSDKSAACRREIIL